MAAIPPSGRQYVVRHGAQEATITEVGGGLRTYTVEGQDVIDGYGEHEMCSVARGSPLIPWPNRLEDGRYEFMGVAYQTPITEPARQNAIHGLTRWLSWDGTQLDDGHLRMSLLLHPQEGYPFTLSLSIDYELAEQGLAVRTTATNQGDQPLPFGAGQHPYLTVGTERIDEASLRLPALLRLEVDARQLPTGRLIQVEDTEFDYLEGRPLGPTKLDTAFTALIPDADGVTRIALGAPDGRRRLTLWMDRSYQYVMVFSGDTIPDPSRRRRSLALEPMTCAPNAFRSGLGLITLQPGESAKSSWGIFAVA
jgi:aldose 1-epimerase